MSSQPPAAEPAAGELVFLYDVDNTLLNNDQLKADADARLHRLLGERWSNTFWRIYETVRREEDVVDIPEATRRFEQECTDPQVCTGVYAVFDHVDFAHYLYPGALDALRHTAQIGTNVILSDGDPVFQRRKITESGLAAAAEGHVLIYIHKERHVDEILDWFSADRYILLDDKPRILKAMPQLLGERLVTVLVCQGHYARDPVQRADFTPNLTLAGIGDLVRYSADDFRARRFAAQGECALGAPVAPGL